MGQVARLQILVDSDKLPLEKELAGPIGHLLQPLPLEHDARDHRGVRQQPVRLQAVGHLEEGKVARLANLQLLGHDLAELLERTPGRRPHLPHAGIDEQDLQDDDVSICRNLRRRRGHVQVCDALLDNLLHLVVAVVARHRLHEEDVHEVVERGARADMLAEIVQQLPTLRLRPCRRVACELLHHLAIDFVCELPVLHRGCYDLLHQVSPLHLRHRTIVHPTQNVVVGIRALGLQPRRHFGQGVLQVHFVVHKHCARTASAEREEIRRLVAAPIVRVLKLLKVRKVCEGVVNEAELLDIDMIENLACKGLSRSKPDLRLDNVLCVRDGVWRHLKLLSLLDEILQALERGAILAGVFDYGPLFFDPLLQPLFRG
mmetsp:Transcript_74185/g.214933  ORF Transcript_74185/g.214933 Transcript_74185/m.214933 type:complete len:373 (+) Transcript_74185:798-1916(+)